MSSKETLQLIIHWLNHKHHAFQCQTTRETQEDSPRTLRFLATDINHQPSKNWSSQNKVEPTEVMYAICYGILLHVSTIFEGFFTAVVLEPPNSEHVIGEHPKYSYSSLFEKKPIWLGLVQKWGECPWHFWICFFSPDILKQTHYHPEPWGSS